MTHVLTTPSMIRLPSFAAAELEAYVKASNTGFFDDFGRAVALSGDTLVVGVPLQGADGDSLVDSGAVYVFRKTDGGWSQEAYLKASNAERDDSFGCAVALSGDTLVVGASGEATGIDSSHPSDLSADDSGAVYVYERTDGMWSQKAYLKASNAEKGDRFGSAVALSGDTLTVAAYLESSNATGINGDQSNNSAEGSGAVYVFERTDGMWSQKAYIKASNTGGGDQFGDAMALSGDTLVVGAFFEDSSATGINGDQLNDDAPDSGAVYVFRRTDGGWMQEAYLKASNTGEGDLFGGAVALSGNTLVVGAAGEDSSATGINGDQSNDGASSSGAVYVFERTNGMWSQEAYLKASNTGVGDSFGWSVALSSGDLSGITLAVGAHFEDSSATGINGDQFDNSADHSGAVYVYRRPSGIVTQTIPPSTPISREWKQQIYVKASNTGKDDSFGASVALSNDTLVVAATGEDSNATGINGDQFDNSVDDSGAVYVYHATK